VVHELYSAGGAAVPLVEAAFPGVTVDGAISRPELSKRVVGNPDAMKVLESIVHPLVQQEKRKFIRDAAERGTPIIVADIPLLYETGAQAQCDAVAVVSAPEDIQRARVLSRPGMTPEKLDAILARQVPDAEKRRRADFLIDTGVALEETKGHVVALLDALRGRKGKAYAALLQGD